MDRVSGSMSGVVMMVLLAGCTGEIAGPAPEAEIPMLSEAEWLTRASLDLRGVRPTEQELAAVEADPAAAGELIATFVDDPRFGSRVRALFSDIYLTRQDMWTVTAEDFLLSDEPGFAAAVGEEPLRVLSTIAEQDLPYTEILTADWTMANELLGTAFPVEYPEGATGWQQVRYTDGRPSAGVLATNGFWWHYTSNATNSNRGRANAVSKLFLCNDYLTRPIEFSRDVNLLDRDAINDALLNNPGCYACHSSLDPMASYLWGFYYINDLSRMDMATYHPERERLWQMTSGVAPGYYGEPGSTLADLGWQITGDARFPSCITEQVFEVLTQRDSVLADTEALSDYRGVLLSGEMRLKPLFRAVVAGTEYRAAVEDDPRYTPKKLMGPELLASQIEDLTGFRFTNDGYDLMLTDTYGVRILAGGVDGVYSTKPAEQPTTTTVLVQERLSQAAASYAVQQETAMSLDQRKLFTLVDLSAAADPQAAAQMQRLTLLVLGRTVEAESQEVTDLLALWQGLYAIDGDAPQAWTGVLSVLMRDPDFILY